MSDTRRWVQPKHTVAAAKRLARAGTKPIQSEKHLQADGNPKSPHFKKRHKFMKGVRNIRPNLQRKINDLRTQEGLDDE